MKTMTCMQLGGACGKEFHANTFDEIAEMSKNHGAEMYHKGDITHLEAMEKMSELMKDPAVMQKWFEQKKKEFESLTEDE